MVCIGLANQINLTSTQTGENQEEEGTPSGETEIHYHTGNASDGGGCYGQANYSTVCKACNGLGEGTCSNSTLSKDGYGTDSTGVNWYVYYKCTECGYSMIGSTMYTGYGTGGLTFGTYYQNASETITESHICECSTCNGTGEVEEYIDSYSLNCGKEEGREYPINGQE